ncbi:MAG: hypothetical protein Q9157_001749 [Trypethelium eluteriae]
MKGRFHRKPKPQQDDRGDPQASSKASTLGMTRKTPPWGLKLLYDAESSAVDRIGNHALNLLNAVATYRDNDDTTLFLTRQRPERHPQRVADLTCGIVFLGTPHHGSGLAKWAEMLAKSLGLLKQTNPQILGALNDDSEVLARIQDGFHAMIRSRSQNGLRPIEITCFYEELPLPGIGTTSKTAEGFRVTVMVPYTSNPRFVGRAEILEKLQNYLVHRNQPELQTSQARAALFGLGDIGFRLLGAEDTPRGINILGTRQQPRTLNAIEIKMRVFGDEHEETLISLEGLATAYNYQERWTEAQELGEQILEVNKRTPGEEDCWTLSATGILVRTYIGQERWTEAQELTERKVEGLKRIKGEEDPLTFFAMHLLSAIYYKQRRWTAAEALIVRVMEVMERVLGEEHPFTLHSMYCLALVWKRLDRHDAAVEVMSKLAERQKRTMGLGQAAHALTQGSREIME